MLEFPRNASPFSRVMTSPFTICFPGKNIEVFWETYKFFITWFSYSTHLKVFNQMVPIFHLDMFFRSGRLLGSLLKYNAIEDFLEVL
uniref:Uncharacterized protein n=2 Tax=Brassica oleracea TaxID=3712 RepID=A0A0D3CEH1_BRAOL|nr:unnamed protein product [Brassica oleracea]